MEFSMSSLSALAGRWITSPAAMRLMTAGERGRMTGGSSEVGGVVVVGGSGGGGVDVIGSGGLSVDGGSGSGRA